ncbi:MAG: response regulator [Actinomycetota bacterium]
MARTHSASAAVLHLVDPADEPTAPAQRHARPRVLLADDNSFFRVGLRGLLMDYEVDVVGEARNGREAVEQAEALRADIVLMDLRMPRLGGIEAAKLIAERSPDTRVIILTAYDEPELRRDADEAAVAAFLVKGSRSESLHEALIAACDNVRPVAEEPSADDFDAVEGGEDALQQLTATQINLSVLRGRVEGEEQTARLDELEQAVEIGIEDLRDLVFEIRPPALEGHGLGIALEALLARHADDGGYHYEVDDRLTSAPPATSYGVALGIAREAIDNVHRHAHAANVSLTIEERDEGLYVEVSDDGQGLAPSDLSDDALGLSSMRSRAEDAGGWCRIWSLPGAGATIKFWLPL